jgi:hypothetical protein
MPGYRYKHSGSHSVTLDKERPHTARMDGAAQYEFSISRWLISGKIDLHKQLGQALTDHAMKSYIALIKEELGPETVARLEAGRPILPFTGRIKPRRAQAA